MGIRNAFGAGISATLVSAAGGCAPHDDPPSAALDAITEAGLHAGIQLLASDSFEGRGPSSAGEAKTIEYLREELTNLGLEPGNGDSFFQAVPLVSITARSTAQLSISGTGGVTRLAYGDGFMAWTKRVVERAEIRESPMVFVGFGIVAPEYGWDDYSGLDVRGKTVVMLVNDPGFATGDPELFNGRTMTYYGRWTYKFEEAARQEAAAALIMHEAEPAGYPWTVVSSSWSGPQFDLIQEDNNMSRVSVEGWIPADIARALFSKAGQNYDSVRSRSATRSFSAVPLGLRASIALRNAIEHSTSNNVLGRLAGRERQDEHIVYMAHWDHLGRDASLGGDQIYNGALDNATGTAGLLELAKAFVALDRRPARSILFLAVGVEEQGLLGSAYYATHPVVPPEKTVAALNMDGLNVWGPMRDLTVVGYGNSELDDYAEAAAAAQSRTVRPDPEPEKGFYYRSDHFSFAREGIPALYIDAGIDHIERGEEWGKRQREDYTANRYHKPSDEYDPSWDLRGAIDDLHLLFAVGYRLASERSFPNWRPGTEFKAKRDEQLRGR